ncbi:agmatinase [Desulfacinum hydrothermale]|uniref:agmatinase n=1 Tax=Desulfacinum hydrothermale TaxID=109258 RepID=UPI00148261F3|nr:agmatinase [Desulfacinum hydrothermale]
MSFLGLHQGPHALERARAVIVPAPYDGTTTYKAGTREGPRAIILASRELELYDEETETEPYREGIATLDELAVTVASPQQMVERVRAVASALFQAGKLPVLLGGEHLLSLGMIQAAAHAFDSLSVLHFDAHPDLRTEYQESAYSNACVMHHVVGQIPLVQVGLRSLTREEHQRIRRHAIPAFFSHQLHGMKDLPQRVVENLGPNVYITIDLDVLDPGIMPAVGTPEPGGMGWHQILSVLRAVSRSRRIVGFDVMELCPLAGLPAPDFLAARLVHKLLAYIFLDRS